MPDLPDWGDPDFIANSVPVRFDIFTRQWNDDKKEWEPSALKAMRDPDGKMRLHGTASSTIKDLHGDTMLLSALEDMERAANNNLTIFGNHSYEVPEDVYGSTESAQIKQAGTVDANGDPIYDLKFSIVVNDENERAVKTFKAIEKGSKLGISIGAMIPEGGAVRDKKSGAYTISHVDLIETSIVGIPANPRSWVENAMKAFAAPVAKAQATASLGTPTLTLDSDTGYYKIEGSIADIAGGESVSFGFGKTAEAPIIGTDADPDVAEAATCPDCGHGKEDGGGCQNSIHSKDVEPEVTDSKIRVIEIDTGDDSGGSSSQGASQSEPAPESADDSDGEDDEVEASGDDVLATASEVIGEVETVMASLDPTVTSAFQQLLTLTDSLTRELAASIAREGEAQAQKDAAERQRDEIVVMAGKLISGTNAILNKLADLPVGRRTKFVDSKAQFAELENIYSSDFLAMLRSKNQ
jgi:phage head maturation protease